MIRGNIMRGLAVFGAIIAIAVGITFYAFQTTPASAPPGVLVRLQLQWFDQAQFAGFYMAKQRGYYAAEGLNVEILPGGYAVRPVDVVESGRADFAIATGDQALIGIDQGKKVKIVGTVFNKSIACFMAHKSLAIATPRDFVGKTVGVYSGFDTENILKILLKNSGVNEKDVDIRPAGSIAAFDHGDIQIWPSYRINEPLLETARGQQVTCLKPEDFGVDYYSDSIITSSDYASNSQLVEKFLRASARGWEYAIAHPDDTIETMLAMNLNFLPGEQSRAHQMAMLQEVIRNLRSDTDNKVLTMDRGRWVRMVKLLQGIHAISDDRDAKDIVDSAVNFSMAESAVASGPPE